MKRIYVLVLSLFTLVVNAQISGDLQANANFYNRDTGIGASNIPLYDNLLSGGDSWLALRYNGENGFNANLRIDGFYNSNLFMPREAYTDGGIGMFNISKEWDKLTATAGYIYDQIGSGILFRSYEDRGLLIDNALRGVHLKYQFNDKLMGKAFTGQTKELFGKFNPLIRAINFEGDFGFAKNKNGHLTPGIGILNRTLDDGSMQNIISRVNNLPDSQKFIPSYNMYAMTLYNTMNIGEFTVYTEAAFKNKDAILDQINTLVQRPGSVYYATVGWAHGKIGVNASAKRTENFVMRATLNNEVPWRGFTNWQPVIAVIRPQRTIARYSPQSLDISEFSKAVNMYYVPNDKYTFNGSYTHINDLNGNRLYRELYLDANIDKIKKTNLHLGLQRLIYSRTAYQIKGKDVSAITPFAEITYKIDKRKSIKADLQYMDATGDFGSWAYALFELAYTPHWSFAVGDMYSFATGYDRSVYGSLVPQHYPNLFVAYTRNAHRFTGQYVKQVEGINCTGGVCRFEPAFSGFRFGVLSSF